MNEPNYRSFLTRLGEPPLLPESLSQMMRRRYEFQSATRLDDAAVHTDPLVAFPLPIYPVDADGVARRWQGDVSFMWNPLAWLPTPLAAPTNADAAGTWPTPSLRIWAANVAITLGASLMYSPEYGFADLAAIYRFDVTSPAGQERLRAWVSGTGSPDPTLDLIERDIHNRLLAPLNPMAAAMMLRYLPGQQAGIAASMRQSLDSTPVPVPARMLETYLAIAFDLLGDAPAMPPYTAADVLRGMRTELRSSSSQPVEEQQVVQEALEDFAGLLDDIAAGRPVGGDA